MSDTTLSTPALPAQDANLGLEQRLQGLRSAAGQGDKAKKAQLTQACQDFEAVFINQIWKQMRASVSKEGLFTSKEGESYVSMFDQELSVKMARSGGIGLAGMLEESLSERLAQASQTTQGQAQLKPLNTPTHTTELNPLPTRTLAALTAQHQAELLAQRIEQAHNPDLASTAKSVHFTLSELEEALKSVRVDEEKL
ncbi:MAG: hypothetical protein GX055_06605 [Desulfovibrionales bacterium]|nr:hypothetical protein [Desulfovibrionales bacterium]